MPIKGGEDEKPRFSTGGDATPKYKPSAKEDSMVVYVPPPDPLDPEPTVQFARLRFYHNEGETTSIPVRTSFGYARTINVEIELLLASTATIVDDWDFVGRPDLTAAVQATRRFTLSFAPYEQLILQPVQIVDDLLAETTEFFSFRIVRAWTTNNNGGVSELAISGNNFFGVVINQSDQPSAPDINFSTAGISVQEGASSVELKVTSSEPATQQITGTITVTPGTGVQSSEYTIPTSYTIDVGETEYVVQVDIGTDVEVEGNEIITLTLGAPSFGNLGSTTTCIVTIIDATILPEIAWAGTNWAVPEGGVGVDTEVVRQIVITNTNELNQANGAALHSGFDVELMFDGSQSSNPATPGRFDGADFYVRGSTVIGFPPGVSSRNVKYVIRGDGDIEANEEIYSVLTKPVGCTIRENGSTQVGTILNDDSVGGGENLRPGFYYKSGTFHPRDADGNLNPTQTVTIVVELNEAYAASNVIVDYEVYEAINCSPSHHGMSATGQITIPAGDLYGFLDVDVDPSAMTGNQRVFVVELTSTSHGQIDAINAKWVGIICGDADTEDLIPPQPAIPGTDDIRVWADRFRVSPFSVDIPIPAGKEPIAYACMHVGDVTPSKRNYTALWEAKNGAITDRKWLQEKTLVVVRVMEDLTSASTQKLAFGKLETFDFEASIELGDFGIPSGFAGDHYGAKDLLIIGDGGTPKKINGITSNNQNDAHWGSCTGSGCPDPPVVTTDMWVDNIQFRNLRFVPPPCRVTVVDNVGYSGARADQDGIWHFYDCVWDNSNCVGAQCPDGMGGIATGISHGNFRFQMRMNSRQSLRMEGNTFTQGQEHCIYANSIGALALIYNNTAPETANGGTGRSFCQFVNRPPESGDQIACGLIAVVNNTTQSNGWMMDTGAKDITIASGFQGDVFIVGNSHTGHLQEPGQNENNRGLVGIVMSEGAGTGAPSGGYAFLYPLVSSYWAAFSFVRIKGEDANLVTTDEWNGSPYLLNGCAYLEIHGWTFTLTPPLGPRACAIFNDSLGPLQGPLYDQRYREITAGRWTTPPSYPFTWGHKSFPNRPGGVSFHGAADPPYNFLSVSQNVGFSNIWATHKRFNSSFFSGTNFNSLTEAQINAYDGSDPL